MAEFSYKIEQLELESLAQPSKITKKDQELIGTFQVDNVFNIAQSRVGVGVYSVSNTLLEYVEDYKDYTFGANAQAQGDRGASIITIDPEKDIQELKYDTGDVRILYNFTNNVYSETQKGGKFILQQVSSDRTEIKAISLELSEEEILEYTTAFKSKLESQSFFSNFRVDFGEGVYAQGINIDTLVENNKLSLIIKLYSPLQDDIILKDTFTVEEVVSDSLLYEITAQPIVDEIKIPYLKGPNFALEEVDKVNEPTEFLNYNELFSYPVSGSYYELFSLFKNAGAEIAINHNSFEDFVHFSSAEERLRNFQYKLQLIESYETSLNTISASNASSGSYYQNEVSGSQTYYEGLIRGLVDNFDHYDRFLYFTSGSNSWPKQNTKRPYLNYSTTSSVATTWFNTQLTAANNYDVSNVDILTNTIPAFIREDSNNEPYLMFIHMIAQHFDNIWIYFKAVSDKYDTDHRLNFGVSKDLVREAIQSFGINLYNSNQNADNLFSMFLGESYQSGSETINTMSIATSASFNSGSTALEYLQPMPKSDYEKEIYKRIYHNLPHLVKTKGTERGLRALINCFGIPESILSIKGFGGSLIEGQKYLGEQGSVTSSLSLSGSYYYRSGSDKIRLDNTGSYVSGSTLSRYVSIEQENKKYSDDLHNVEVAFDISHGVNEHIIRKISSSFDIDQYIGDPRRRYEEGYPSLDKVREDVLAKPIEWQDIQQYWNSGSWAWEDTLAYTKSPKSFVRLLKFFDSSLFKIIKDFVPARSKVDTGIIVKSNILGRSKAKQVEVSFTDEIYSGSLITNTVSASQGGVYDDSGSFNYTTNYSASYMSPLGPVPRNITDESPMYTGELSGSLVLVSDGEVGKNNPFIGSAQPLIELDITVFNFSLPPPPACYIALTGSYLGESYTVGIVDDTDTDEAVSVTYPTSVTGIISDYQFAHDFDTYEFFTIQASGVYNTSYYPSTYAGYTATFAGWYNNSAGTGSAISTSNPLTIYRYDEETMGNKFYAKFNQT